MRPADPAGRDRGRARASRRGAAAAGHPRRRAARHRDARRLRVLARRRAGRGPEREGLPRAGQRVDLPDGAGQHFFFDAGNILKTSAKMLAVSASRSKTVDDTSSFKVSAPSSPEPSSPQICCRNSTFESNRRFLLSLCFSSFFCLFSLSSFSALSTSSNHSSNSFSLLISSSPAFFSTLAIDSSPTSSATRWRAA